METWNNTTASYDDLHTSVSCTTSGAEDKEAMKSLAEVTRELYT